MNLLKPHKRSRLLEALMLGLSIREAMKHSGVAINTARRYSRLNGPFKCPCGRPRQTHRGWCSERLKRSPLRREFLARWRKSRGVPPPVIVEPAISKTNSLPGRRADGAMLFRAVNAAVSRSLPEHVRADICQDVLIDVLEGRATINSLGESIRLALRRHRKTHSDGWMPASLDDIVPGTDNLRRGDLIPNDAPHF